MADWVDGLEAAIDNWSRRISLTEEQVATLRANAVSAQSREGLPVPDNFTCDGCGRVTVCLCAFDAYNTDGDCLWEK